MTLSERSGEIMEDFRPLSMKLPEDVIKEAKTISPSRKKSGGASAGASADRFHADASAGRTSADIVLFDLLKNQRTKLAAASRVPAYIIFTDATLKDMCQKCPMTIEEFLEVSGVGDSKAKKYGKVFTEVIRDYVGGQD